MEETRQYISGLTKVRAKLLERDSAMYAEPSWVRITTITMTSKFLEDFNFNQFKVDMKKLGKVRIRNKNSSFSGFEWSMKDTTFYNQVTVTYRDSYSNKSVKLFPNGSIQAAGCSNLIDCTRVLTLLQELIRVVLKADKVVPVAAPTIQMINTNFSLNCSVNLRKVITKFASNTRFDVTFDPDKYSAVKIKFEPGEGMKKVTASIFSTGKVIVTGARTLQEIVHAYEIINTMITDKELVEKSEKNELFEVFMGVKFGDWKNNV